MAQDRFSWFDVVITILSLTTLILDVVTDVAVTVLLYLDLMVVWGSLTLVFVVVPHLVISVFSLKWHSTDRALTCSIILPHVCLLTPFQRYIRVLWLGFKSNLTGHPRYTDAALREQNDASILRLFETFLESAPQLVLQLSVMLLYPARISWVQVLSTISSLISLSWALTAYCDSARLSYQSPYIRRVLAMAMHLLWQLFMATARVSALVLFTSFLQAWICLFAGIHWVIMTIWIWVKGTNFGQGRLEKALFHIASGFIYVFAYVNLHDGPTRSRMVPYYCLVFLENGVLFTIWVIYGGPVLAMKIAAAVLVFGGFLLGGLCLMVYYRWLHPSGPHYLFTIKSRLPATLFQGQDLQRSKDHVRQQEADTLGHSPSVLKGSTLELSVETETPRKGDPTLSPLMDSVALDALESAWQSGMQSSTSSSSSSLVAEDCSLDDFNATAKSESLIRKDSSHSEHNSSKSQLLSATVKTHPVDYVCPPLSASDNPNTSQRSLSGSLLPSDYSVTPDLASPHIQNKAEPEMEDIIETEELKEAEKSALGQEDDRTAVGCIQQQRPKSRWKLSQVFAGPDVVTPLSKPALQRCPSSTPIAKPHGAVSKTQLRTGLAAGRFGKKESGTKPGQLSPAGGPSMSESHSPANSLLTSDKLTASKNGGGNDCMSQSFDLRKPLTLSPQSAEQSSSHIVVSHDTSFTRVDREAMAAYPDIVESMSTEPQQPRMFLGSDDMFVERAGGESMWGVSPNMSNNSSSQSQEQELSLPASVSRLPRLVDSFDSGSEPEPACPNTNDLQDLHPTEEQKLEGCPKNSSTSESPAVESPAANNDDTEISWSSMNVNENEWSGLNNLKALTPDESLCSFASNDQEEMCQAMVDTDTNRPKNSPVHEGAEEAFSRSSTPSLARSRSTSSLYHEFSSAGVSPSPPPGLRAASRLSRNHSWVNSPFMSEAWQPPADTSWPLDYVSVNPAPPVHHDPNTARLDPKEVVIQMLMDQLKRTSLRHGRLSEESYFPSPTGSHLRSPPVHDSRTTALNQMLSHLLEDSNATTMSHSEHGIRGRSHHRSDIDLMRKALDLIEMERFPHRFRQETSDTGSPERYVSGQYRPPIVDQGSETPQHLSGQRSAAGAHSQSRLNTSQRQLPVHAAAIPKEVSGGHPKGVYHDDTQPCGVPHSMVEPQSISSGTGQREGLYRYFVHSNSPIHTPLWNTPHNTPAATPSQRHLLHRYLTQAHVEVGLREERAQSAETRSLRKPGSSKSEVRDQMSSTLPADSTALTREASDASPDVLTMHDGRKSGTVPHGFMPQASRTSGHHPHSVNPHVDRLSSVHPHNMTTHAGRTTDSMAHPVMPRAGRAGNVRCLSEKLEVVTDNPDSGMHSGSHSTASRRQPLQSLDNSPSLSPSSITQQPVHAKPVFQFQAAKSSDKHRHSYAGGRSSSGQSSQVPAPPGIPRHSSHSRPQSHRQPGDRSLDRNRQTASVHASEDSDRRRAKSVDSLR